MATATLAAPVRQRRIAGVQRNIQRDGQIAFQLGGIEYRQVRLCRIAHGLSDALQQARAFKDLLGDAARGGIVGAEQRQALARVRPGNAGQQIQVVVDDDVRNRRRGHENDARVRHAQQHQHAQLAFFVVTRAGDFGEHVGIQAEPRNHDHGARHQRVVLHAFEQRASIAPGFRQIASAIRIRFLPSSSLLANAHGLLSPTMPLVVDPSRFVRKGREGRKEEQFFD